MVRLAVGAFLTSPGFGGLAALTVAAVAYKKLREDRQNGKDEIARLAADRWTDQKDRLAQDARQRWMTSFTWLNAAYTDGYLQEEPWMDGLTHLAKIATTKEQKVLVRLAMSLGQEELG